MSVECRNPMTASDKYPDSERVGVRIKEARRRANLTQAALADKIGRSRTALAQWETSKHAPDHEAVKLIARHTQQSLAWLTIGESEPAADGPQQRIRYESSGRGDTITSGARVVQAPVLYIDASAPGASVVEAADRRPVVLEQALIASGIEPDNIGLIDMIGPSMGPWLPDGSRCVLDRGDTALRDGEIYALRDRDMLRIRVVIPLPGGGMRLHAYSDAYPDEVLTSSESAERIQVLGRVFQVHWSSPRR